MTPAAFRRRLDRLERFISQTKPGVSFWDALYGAVSAEHVTPKDIADWDKIAPFLEEGARLAAQPDPIEAAIVARLTAPASEIPLPPA